jgi:hypothetical protein
VSGGIASCSSCSIPGERALGTHWIGGWVGPRASMDAVAKRKIPSPFQESNPSCPARSLVAISTVGASVKCSLQETKGVEHNSNGILFWSISRPCLWYCITSMRCGYEVPGMIFIMYTYSLLRGITFEVLPLSSYALCPMILSLLELFWKSCCGITFNATVTFFFGCLQYPEIFVPLR